MFLSANILNNFDCSTEAGRGAACLGEACEAQICALVVLEDDEKFDNERHRFEIEAYNDPMVSLEGPQIQVQHYAKRKEQRPPARSRIRFVSRPRL